MTQDTNHKNVDYRNTNYCPSLDSVGEKKQTPSEFKRLAILYHEIEKGDIQQLADMFERNENVDRIIEFVNSRTIGRDWEGEKIRKLDEMRRKLVGRRIV